MNDIILKIAGTPSQICCITDLASSAEMLAAWYGGDLPSCVSEDVFSLDEKCDMLRLPQGCCQPFKSAAAIELRLPY